MHELLALLPDEGDESSAAPLVPREAEGLAMLADCRRFFEDDKLFQALRVERKLAEQHPELHKESELVEKVRVAGHEAEEACKDLDGDGGAWTVVREGAFDGDCRVWYREEEGAAIHSLRVAADIEAPLEYLLVLLNEVVGA
jgi:hypothetical protein